MLLQNVYMIRGSVGVGPFGTDWNVKFFMMFIAFGMCWYDQRTRKRNDYWWVLLFASVIWGLAELILQTLGIRDFSAKIMFGWNIPLWVSIPIQGIVEGGLVTVGSLFVGDRLLEKKSRFGTSLIFTLMMVILIAAAFIQDILLNYTGPDYGGNVPSRRNMFTPLPVILLIVMIVISIMFFIKAPPVLRRRGWMLFIVMILFGICWTLGEWGAGYSMDRSRNTTNLHPCASANGVLSICMGYRCRDCFCLFTIFCYTYICGFNPNGNKNVGYNVYKS